MKGYIIFTHYYASIHFIFLLINFDAAGNHVI